MRGREGRCSKLSFGVVVIDAPSNRMADLLPIIPELLQAIDAVRTGEVRHVGKCPKGRGESGHVSPEVWRPQRDSNPCFGLESEKEGGSADRVICREIATHRAQRQRLSRESRYHWLSR